MAAANQIYPGVFIRRTAETVFNAAHLAHHRRQHFTFLAWPAGPGAEERFEQLAEVVRTFYQNAPIAHYGIRFRAADEAMPAVRSTTLLNVQVPHLGEILLGMYERMLQSGSAHHIEGFTVSFENVGPDIPYLNAGGWGRPAGSKHLPAEWKGNGLDEHPQADRLTEEQARSHCGFRALLLAKWESEGEGRKGVEEWQAEAEELARSLGREDGKMRLVDIAEVVKKEGWRGHRIVIFNEWRRIQFADKGVEWVWQEGMERKEVDRQTLHILWDNAKEHYLWIKSPKAFFEKHASKGKEYMRCMACFQTIRVAMQCQHNCDMAGKYQCHLCLKPCGSEEFLKVHTARTPNKDYPACEMCGQMAFFGEECFEQHKVTNCKPLDYMPPNVTRVECESCGYVHRSDRKHTCMRPNRCRFCGSESSLGTVAALEFHRCAIQDNEQFWEPVEERKKEGEVISRIWRSQFFYDFETYRATELAADSYTLEVLAWCIRLILPDEATKRFVREEGALHDMVDALEKLRLAEVKWECFPGEEDDVPRIRIWGKGINTFIGVTEKVLSRRERKNRWTPTLWAHNGSKFDVKFIFDYYINVVNMNLTGMQCTFETGVRGEPKRNENGEIEWKMPKAKRVQKDAVQLSTVGSKILMLKVNGLKYCCSHAHLTMPLRKLPKTLGVKVRVEKGEFPYGRLSPQAWTAPACKTGLPGLKEYEVDALPAGRRKEVIQWWVEEQTRRWANPEFILECLRETLLEGEEGEDHVATVATYRNRYESHRKGRPPSQIVNRWQFTKELWKYLKSDVDVGAVCMEAYHRAAEEMHQQIWEEVGELHEHSFKRMVSPLGCSTAPSWAYRLYNTWFMPRDELIVLKPAELRFVRESLRGGRTDKRANYIEVTRERREKGDRLVYVDFKSLYPSVQQTDVHGDVGGTHFPVGPPVWYFRNDVEVNNESLKEIMGNTTGFVRVTTESTGYVTHPTLHRLRSLSGNEKTGIAEPDDSLKLVFANENIEGEVYGWPELLEAMDSGEVRVKKLHKALQFRKGENVFDKYVQFFFRMKQQAEDSGNEGLRSLAKLLLNALWGKLGQRSYPVREWVGWKDRLEYLWQKFSNKEYVVHSFEQKEPTRAWIQYSIEGDVNNARTTAPHIAAFVSMWGRIMLHRKLLRPHGQRALYCDTDSAILYLRPCDRQILDPYLGKQIGQLTDEVRKIVADAGYSLEEYTDPFIEEAVFVAPKTYALKIRNEHPPLVYHKVVCKGFEPSFKNAKHLHFQSMKELVWTHNKLKAHINGKRELTESENEQPQRRYIRDGGRLQFVARLSDTRVKPIERTITKQLSGTYTKGKTIEWEPRLVQPFGEYGPREEEGSFLDFKDVTRQYN